LSRCHFFFLLIDWTNQTKPKKKKESAAGWQRSRAKQKNNKKYGYGVTTLKVNL